MDHKIQYPLGIETTVSATTYLSWYVSCYKENKESLRCISTFNLTDIISFLFVLTWTIIG